MYFKRFFLERSLMEEEPKSLMLAALYLAGKVEEERIDVDDLLPKCRAARRMHMRRLGRRAARGGRRPEVRRAGTPS